MKRRDVISLVVGAALSSSACGSSPEPVFFTMASVRGAARTSWAHSIEIRRPAMAGYLDRAEIVRRIVAYRLKVAAGDDWSEPLAEMFERVLTEDLATRLPASTVFTEQGPLSITPEAILSLDVQRFDMEDDDSVTLIAQFTVTRPPSHNAIISRRVRLDARTQGSDISGVVSAMSMLTAELADAVVAELQGPEASQPSQRAASNP